MGDQPLRLGPLMRHVTETSAAVWVETAAAAEVTVEVEGASWSARTFRVHDHHYALVVIEGLRPGTTTAYEVHLDGERAWPPPTWEFPPSVIRTPGGGPVRVLFGSCRAAAPHEPPWTLELDHSDKGRGVDALYAHGLRMLEQQPDLTVLAEAADGHEALALARRLRPDVVLMDIRMPGMDGIAATGRVVAERLARVLVLTTFDADDFVIEALRAGASGYLLKDVDPQDLVAAVRATAVGDLPLSPSVLRRVVDGYVRQAHPSTDPRLNRLSAREREVLVLLGEGLSNAEICERLVVSLPTVKTHVAGILAKLDLRDRVQAAVLAHRNGLVP